MPAEDIPPATGDDPEPWRLPDAYARTGLYMQLAVCERFKLDPRGLDAMAPGERAVLLAYERVRQAEEARGRAALMGGGI